MYESSSQHEHGILYRPPRWYDYSCSCSPPRRARQRRLFVIMSPNVSSHLFFLLPVDEVLPVAQHFFSPSQWKWCSVRRACARAYHRVVDVHAATRAGGVPDVLTRRRLNHPRDQ